MPPNIEINFDQPNAAYFSGQIVSGTVTIILNKPKKIKGVLLNFYGFGKAEWYSDKNKKKDGPADFSGSEEYLLLDTYLLDSPNGNFIDVPAGTQSYMFQHQLPDSLPTSYEGVYGHIRYVAKVTIERPWKHNYAYATEFTVYKIIDLERNYPQFKAPTEAEEQKRYGCICCKTAPLIIRARIPRTGFAPGQIIPISINMSSKTIEVIDLRIFLRKLVTYRAENPMVSFKQEHVELIQKNAGSLQSGSTSAFEEKLIVPNVPPSTLMYSNIIQINYDIKIEAVLMENRSRVILLCPITIGSVPNIVSQTLSNTQDDQLIETEMLAQQTSVNIPPPDYVEREGQVNESFLGIEEDVHRTKVAAMDVA